MNKNTIIFYYSISVIYLVITQVYKKNDNSYVDDWILKTLITPYSIQLSLVFNNMLIFLLTLSIVIINIIIKTYILKDSSYFKNTGTTSFNVIVIDVIFIPVYLIIVEYINRNGHFNFIFNGHISSNFELILAVINILVLIGVVSFIRNYLGKFVYAKVECSAIQGKFILGIIDIALVFLVITIIVLTVIKFV